MAYTLNESKAFEVNAAFKKEIADIKQIISQVPNTLEFLTEEFLRQRKQIALHANLLAILIENKLISVTLWQKNFSIYMNQSVESISDPDIIEFIEELIVVSLLEKACISTANIPELISSIELFSKNKDAA
mmetsp:Transcript_42614/g.49811  ORF Transcript_42614/g.49811 Transcript_42614/m.49811 type:complete len:131 (+) Transcript_42614:1781-2173(+)